MGKRVFEEEYGVTVKVERGKTLRMGGSKEGKEDIKVFKIVIGVLAAAMLMGAIVLGGGH